MSQNRPSPKKASLRWYRGNTHTHTLNSDGDSTPDDVVRWYREHNYHFLVLTDHNYLTSVEGLNALHGANEKFIVIKGEEVSDWSGDKPIHVNGLNIARVVEPQGGGSVVETIQRNVDAIVAASGTPHVNHPNFRWAITADDLKEVQRCRLLEIHNGGSDNNNLGGGGMPGHEQMWDTLLTSGKLMYGIAVDDAHEFKRPWDSNISPPGTGWVVARAERLSAEAILAALEQGDFYASTGVELEDYQVDERGVTITIKEEKWSKYRVQFIGGRGRTLREATANPAVYEFKGDEGYLRAKVIESNGKLAWTQPVMLGKP